MRVGCAVQDFYNRTPFPDYELDCFNDKEDLRVSAYPFAEVLDRSIPQSGSVIDVGTGTGQLSAFLSLRRVCVWGVDFSEASLGKAKALKEKLGLDSLHLELVDITDGEQVRGLGVQFDYVLCLGVLHHTEDPYQSFKNILPLLKPDGFIAVGLYNKVGRIPLKARKLLSKTLFRNNDAVKDWFIRMQIGSVEDRERARGWWNDQYNHVHETSHTVGEVLSWFSRNGIKYVQTLPPLNPFDRGVLEVAGVWNGVGEIKPFLPVRAYSQLTWLWKTHREGGYWITFGQKKEGEGR